MLGGDNQFNYLGWMHLACKASVLSTMSKDPGTKTIGNELGSLYSCQLRINMFMPHVVPLSSLFYYLNLPLFGQIKDLS